MKKKMFAMLLCLTILLSMAACSAPSSQPASGAASVGGEDRDEIVLELWYWQSSLNDELIEQVSEQFPGIRINANKFNSENMQEKVITALASDSPLPDILVMDDWVSNVLPDADKFYNLYDAPFNAAEYRDNYVEWKWEKAETADGSKLIAIPIDAGPTAMFYRADLFEAAAQRPRRGGGADGHLGWRAGRRKADDGYHGRMYVRLHLQPLLDDNESGRVGPRG